MRAVPERAADDASLPLSRLAKLQEEFGPRYVPEMPPLEYGGQYLLDHLEKVGPATPSGMGMLPLTQEELGWYQLNTGITFAPWELDIFRTLSFTYVDQNAKAQKRNCEPPWDLPDARIIVSKSMKQALEELSKL